MIKTYHTLEEFLDINTSSYDDIYLVVSGRRMVINDHDRLECRHLKYYLKNTSLSKYKDYIVIDAATEAFLDYTKYTLYIEPPIE